MNKHAYIYILKNCPNAGASEASGGPFWITLTDTLICAWKLKSYRTKQLLLKGLWHNSILIIASPHTHRHTHIQTHIQTHWHTNISPKCFTHSRCSRASRSFAKTGSFLSFFRSKTLFRYTYFFICSSSRLQSALGSILDSFWTLSRERLNFQNRSKMPSCFRTGSGIDFLTILRSIFGRFWVWFLIDFGTSWKYF